MRVKERFPKKLLVEGNDDQHVIWALCEKFQVIENFDVIDTEGIDNLLEQISVRIKQSGTQAIGIIVDADIQLKARWIKLSAILGGLGFDCPENLPHGGLILNTKSIYVGLWVMPDNNTNGMLEDFISFLVPEKDELFAIAQTTLETIEERNLNKYHKIHKSKALIHSWLSWQDDPGTPMGLAITKKYLNTSGEHCNRFVSWLKRTFA